MHWCQQENDLVIQGISTIATVWGSVSEKAVGMFRYIDNGLYLLEQEIKRLFCKR